MDKRKELINSINNRLIELGLTEIDINTEDQDQLDQYYAYDNICEVVNYVSSVISIDKAELDTDSRYEISTYLRTKKHKGYTVILYSSFESYVIESVENLADVILNFEDEASHLQLTYT